MRITGRIVGHGAAVVALTLLSQLGGIAWLLALRFRRRAIAFVAIYALLWGLAFITAPMTGRVPLPCFGEPLRMQSAVYCVLNRHYVTPELARVAQDAATDMAAAFPGTVTLALDGGFPFITGMPLIPHLSHDDGEKLDFAFFYAAPDGTYLPGQTRSPIGYFAFERVGDPGCAPTWFTLRWDLPWLQPLWPARKVDPERTAALISIFANDARVGKVFVEPPLARTLGQSHPKLRFQGCRAARHDDHIHIQL